MPELQARSLASPSLPTRRTSLTKVADTLPSEYRDPLKCCLGQPPLLQTESIRQHRAICG